MQVIQSYFKSSFYTTHPNICLFIEKLKEIQIETYIKLNYSVHKYINPLNTKILKKKKPQITKKFN